MTTISTKWTQWMLEILFSFDVCLSVCVCSGLVNQISLKRLKLQSSNLTYMFPGTVQTWPLKNYYSVKIHLAEICTLTSAFYLLLLLLQLLCLEADTRFTVPHKTEQTQAQKYTKTWTKLINRFSRMIICRTPRTRMSSDQHTLLNNVASPDISAPLQIHRRKVSTTRSCVHSFNFVQNIPNKLHGEA